MTDPADRPILSVPVSERDHTLGADGAPITLVEYGDYQCPSCKEAYSTIKQLRINLGPRMRFVFRNFPKSMVHRHAQHAAEAAEIAAALGKFWEMHAVLYEHQNHLDDRSLAKYAAGLGLDTDRFKRELAHHTYAERVHEDFMSGVRSGVNATPTFFINSYRHNGTLDFMTLMMAMDAAAPLKES
ncbi:MAG: thioredoxin domain-containing protein [Anaerolineaceae bacterium]|nr:thioredoxin domain-containing protein [Anaerolineaceae bacterium]